jgi:hypothetical protein
MKRSKHAAMATVVGAMVGLGAVAASPASAQD